MTRDWWSRYATSAALDRLAAGRALDPAWVAQLETEATATVRQAGGRTRSVMAALDHLHTGLAAAAYQDHATRRLP